MLSRDVLSDLIEETVQERQEVETELVHLEERFGLLKATKERLAAEEEAFRLAFARRYPEDLQDAAGSTETAPGIPDTTVNGRTGNITWTFVPQDWADLPRTEAVYKAIELVTEHEPHAGPSEIEKVFKSRGRADNKDEIGGAIAHLNRSKRIRSLGRAQWVINRSE